MKMEKLSPHSKERERKNPTHFYEKCTLDNLWLMGSALLKTWVYSSESMMKCVRFHSDKKLTLNILIIQ